MAEEAVPPVSPSINVKPGDISIDENGVVTIKNPALAAVLEKAKNDQAGNPTPQGVNLWKCNEQCPQPAQ